MEVSILIPWKLPDSFQAENSVFHVLTKISKEIGKKEMIKNMLSILTWALKYFFTLCLSCDGGINQKILHTTGKEYTP